jgi:hypothetical protein
MDDGIEACVPAVHTEERIQHLPIVPQVHHNQFGAPIPKPVKIQNPVSFILEALHYMPAELPTSTRHCNPH